VTAGTLFDARADWYDAAHDRGGIDGQLLRARLATVTELVGPGPGDVVDVGMGPGRLLEALRARGWTVAGVDVSERMVGLARQRLADAAERLVVAPAEQLPFDDESFDAAAATGVLEYAADAGAALAEVARVLRGGGRLVASVPNPRALHVLSKRAVYPAVARMRRRDAPGPRRWIEPGRLDELAAAAGLVLERTVPTSFAVVPVPLDRLAGRTAVRLAAALERRRALPAALATQVVFVAAKPQ